MALGSSAGSRVEVLPIYSVYSAEACWASEPPILGQARGAQRCEQREHSRVDSQQAWLRWQMNHGATPLGSPAELS